MTALGALFTLLLIFGVTARLTRLVTEDTIAAPLRAAVIRRYGPQSKTAEWIACPWCVGLYIAVAVAALGWALGASALLPWTPGWIWVPALALTNNYLVARLQT